MVVAMNARIESLWRNYTVMVCWSWVFSCGYSFKITIKEFKTAWWWHPLEPWCLAKWVNV